MASHSTEELTTLQYWLANEDVYTSDYVRKWLERTPPERAADTLASIAQYAQPESHSFWWMMFHGLTTMLTTAEIISENSPAGRKMGVRAAMLMANLHDPRACAPLVRVFETHWFWEGKYQAAIETALLRLLADPESVLNGSLSHSDLRELAARIWRTGNHRQELSSRRSDLLIAALHRLKPIVEESDTTLLKSLASAKTLLPQRRKVQEAAASLLKEC